MLVKYFALNFNLSALMKLAEILKEDSGLKFEMSFYLSEISIKSTD